MASHDRVERAFERWGRFVCRRRGAVIAAVLLFTAVLGAQLPRLEADFSRESFLPAGDPVSELYDEFRERFDRDDVILVGVNPPEVFDLAFLEKLRSLHRDLEREVPYVEEVTSLVNARWTRGEGDELIVEELMEDWPRDAAELEALRVRALANPLYVNTLLSRDADFTVVTIKPFTYSAREAEHDLAGFDDAKPASADAQPEFLTVQESREQVVALDAVAARYRAQDFPLHVLGESVLGARLRTLSRSEATRFISLSALLITVVLLVLFRRPLGAVLPLLVILASVVSTFGCMALLRIPFAATFQIVPAFLIAIGVCDSVHVLAIFYRRVALGDARDEAIVFSLRHSGLAVVMTSLTTAAGLASFMAAEIQPVANLGVVSPLGVLLALFYTLTLLPALLAVAPGRTARGAGAGRSRRLDALLAGLGEVATRHPWKVLLGAFLVVALGLTGLARVRLSYDTVRILPEGDPTRTAMELLDRELEGTVPVEVLIDTGRENGLHEPQTLARLEAAMRRAESLDTNPPGVGKALSLVDLVKELHQALNANEPSAYALPRERRLVAQELLLFENTGWDDIDDFTDSQQRTARMTLRTTSTDSRHYPLFLSRLDASLHEALGEDLPFRMTGVLTLNARTFTGLLTSLARSYVLALVVITPLMIVLIGDVRRGLASMIPNLIPVVATLGLMGWLDIPLNFSTLLVASIVIGVAVDDTIHFMLGFARYREAGSDVDAAVRETLLTTGSAMFVTSLVLGLGFGIFTLAYMVDSRYIGLLVSFATVVAFVADVLVAPALMALLVRDRAVPAGSPSTGA